MSEKNVNNQDLIVFDRLGTYLQSKGINNFSDLYKVMREKNITSSDALSDYILSEETDFTLTTLLRTMVQQLKSVRLNHASTLTTFRGSGEVASFIQDIFEGKDQEELKVFYLNTKNKLIAIRTIFKGTNNKSTVHPRDIFKWALIYNATSIIIAHNHPSGDVTPSQQDVDITRKLFKAGESMGIGLLDHFIVSDNDYLSFAEAGLLG